MSKCEQRSVSELGRGLQSCRLFRCHSGYLCASTDRLGSWPPCPLSVMAKTIYVVRLPLEPQREQLSVSC